MTEAASAWNKPRPAFRVMAAGIAFTMQEPPPGEDEEWLDLPAKCQFYLSKPVRMYQALEMAAAFYAEHPDADDLAAENYDCGAGCYYGVKRLPGGTLAVTGGYIFDRPMPEHQLFSWGGII